MRGYFGIGCEGVSKPRNIGAVMRTAHAFDASFVFVVAPNVDVHEMRSVDTSDAAGAVPFYFFPTVAAVELPAGCRLVGVELMTDAIMLPSFRHPLRAAYVLGSERGGLSRALLERCDHVIRIPTRFSINLALAGGIVMYDRMISLGRFAERPVRPGGPSSARQPREG